MQNAIKNWIQTMASMNYFLSEDVTWWENEGHRRLSDILHCKLDVHVIAVYNGTNSVSDGEQCK